MGVTQSARLETMAELGLNEDWLTEVELSQKKHLFLRELYAVSLKVFAYDRRLFR